MKTLLLTLTTTTLLALPSLAQDRDKKRDQPEHKGGDLEHIEKRLKSAVAKGDMTEEQAKAKYAEVKKNLAKTREEAGKKDRPVSPKQFPQKRQHEQMRKHQAEAKERMQMMRREAEHKHREQQERRKHEEREHNERREREEREHHGHKHSERQLDEAREHAERQQEHHRRARFEAIERSLHQAVEGGLISGLDAQKTMAKLQLAAIKHQQKKNR